jgi:hypothetical protein
MRALRLFFGLAFLVVIVYLWGGVLVLALVDRNWWWAAGAVSASFLFGLFVYRSAENQRLRTRVKELEKKLAERVQYEVPPTYDI